MDAPIEVPSPAADGEPAPLLDRAFLRRQCFGDEALEAELLALFVASAAALVAAVPAMTYRDQDEAAHRLKGSCQGIGAWAMARAAGALERADPCGREHAAAALVAAYADVARVIDEAAHPR